MTELLNIRIMINLKPLILWLLLNLAISIVNYIRHLFFKHKLLTSVKEQEPELFKEINASKSNLVKFIATIDDTGNDTIDLLRIKTRRAGKFFIVPLLYVVLIVVHFALLFFITVRF